MAEKQKLNEVAQMKLKICHCKYMNISVYRKTKWDIYLHHKVSTLSINHISGNLESSPVAKQLEKDQSSRYHTTNEPPSFSLLTYIKGYLEQQSQMKQLSIKVVQ